MTISLYLAFTLATVLMCLTPGPAVLLVTSQAMARGFRAGLLTSLGILTGNTLAFVLSVAGLGALLYASALAFTIIKWIGAAYLIYLGVTTIFNARKTAEAAGTAPASAVWAHPYVQGLVKQMTNPKQFIYFGALLPQFIIPGQTELHHFVLLYVTMQVIEISILSTYAFAAAHGGAFLRGPIGILWRERLAGAAQIAVGSLLAGLRRAA